MKKDLWKVSPEEAKNKVLMAFEFALVVTEVAREMNIEITKELVKTAEDILLKEMVLGDSTYFAKEMQNLTMAVFGSIEEKKITFMKVTKNYNCICGKCPICSVKKFLQKYNENKNKKERKRVYALLFLR